MALEVLVCVGEGRGGGRGGRGWGVMASWGEASEGGSDVARHRLDACCDCVGGEAERQDEVEDEGAAERSRAAGGRLPRARTEMNGHRRSRLVKKKENQRG